ncbi:MAG: LPXTG cell wall anchor domain-containing protein, partial [Atopobiaceae bacterium]|nr:LPXTG cell wall anchor domain-containing protein [Atopobiaceae bacterium]
STGGMGTTILYIVGGIMVAGAIVVLITKKRVNSIEK